MRRYPNGTYAELHSLACAYCEEEDWGYRLIEGPTPESVESVKDDMVKAICPACLDALPEDWHNADHPAG